MLKAQISNKQRKIWAKVRPLISDAMFEAMTADAQAVVDEMNRVNEMIFSARMPGVNAHDAVPAGVLPSMLEVIVAQAERERETQYEWRGLFPVTRYDWRCTDIKIPVWSSEGMAAWYYGGGNHPNVTVGMRYVTINMRTYSEAYTVDWLEAQRETFAGVQSETEKVNRVYIGLDAFASAVIYEGNTEAGFSAFIGHANIPDGEVPHGAWDATDATAAQIHEDIIYAVNQVYSNNDGVEGFAEKRVDVWVSPGMYRIAASMILNTTSNESALAVALKDPRIKSIKAVTRLAAATCGANDYIIVGVFEETEITVPMGADADRMPVQDGGHFLTQPFFTTIGGIFVKFPLSFWRGTGLLDT